MDSCYNKSDITNKGTGTYNVGVGGIVGGSNSSEITNCYNQGSIKNDVTYGNSPRVGGIVGDGYLTTIANCYNIGNVSAIDSLFRSAGGICGSGGTISNCFNLGTVSITGSSTSKSIGAITTAGTVESSYYSYRGNDYTDTSGYYNGNLNTIVKELTEFQELSWDSSYSWNFTEIWNIDDINNINNGYPYLRIFEECKITYEANNGTGNSVVKIYLKSQTTVQILDNEFGFVNGDMNFSGWQIVGDESEKIYNVGDTIKLNENIVLQAVWVVSEYEVKFNINTNVGAVLMISDDNGYVQQIFVDKVDNYNDSKPTFTLILTPDTVYKVIISVFYTTNINFGDNYGNVTLTKPFGQTLIGNVLTFTACENLIIRLNLNSFIGNNGIVI